MKKIDLIITNEKLLIIAIVYLLFLITIIACNTGTGRYQPIGGHGLILDTKNGKMYQNTFGKLNEYLGN